MALWQFTLDLIPASSASVGGVDAIHLGREQLDTIRLNLSEDDLGKLFNGLATLLPEKKSWAPDLRIWGDEKLNDVQVYFEGQAIELVQLRLDVSDLSISFVSGLCALARRLDCVFATRLGAVVQPSSEAVMRAVMQSPAMSYVRDPQGYLEEAVRADRETD